MDSNKLNRWLTLAANFGVVIGIIFLALELRQNNDALNLQARLDREDVVRQGILSRLENPDVIQATAKAIREESLSLEEEILLGDLNRSALMNWWIAFRQAQDGVIDSELLPVDIWRRYFHDIHPRMPQSWEEFKLTVPQETDFIQWFETNVVNTD